MKPIVIRLAIAALFALSAAPAAADTRTEITAALDHFAKVWNEGDFDAILGYYHPDFILVTSDGVVSRKQRIADLETIAQSGGDRGRLEYSQVKVRAMEESHALAWGRVRLSFRDGSGFDTWFTTVYEHTPFGWKALLTRN